MINLVFPNFPSVEDTLFKTSLLATVQLMLGADPPVGPTLINVTPAPIFPNNTDESTATVAGTMAAGTIQGTASAASVAVSSSQLSTAWSTSTTSEFLASCLSAATATVTSAGQSIGTGAVTLAAGAAASLAVSGADQYSVSGSGNLSFYGPAEWEHGRRRRLGQLHGQHHRKRLDHADDKRR